MAASLVHLTAEANSPAGNPIRYKWISSGGRIAGDGPVGYMGLGRYTSPSPIIFAPAELPKSTFIFPLVTAAH